VVDRLSASGNLANSSQLEGSVARGSSNPVPVQNLSIPTASTRADQRADGTIGGGDDGRVEDERKYCFCDRISFGEMVGCDDPQCEREWVRILSKSLQAPLVLMMQSCA